MFSSTIDPRCHLCGRCLQSRCAQRSPSSTSSDAWARVCWWQTHSCACEKRKKSLHLNPHILAPLSFFPSCWVNLSLFSLLFLSFCISVYIKCVVVLPSTYNNTRLHSLSPSSHMYLPLFLFSPLDSVQQNRSTCFTYRRCHPTPPSY